MPESTIALFDLALAGLLAHELDAVQNREWRILYVLRGMPDDVARQAFILLHVPLFAVLLWLISASDPSLRHYSTLGLDAFMVVHAGLHWRLSAHPKYEFHEAYSRSLIYGTALLAGLHLALKLLGVA